MGYYKIKINIGIYNGSDQLAEGVVVASEGDMTENKAESIDAVERALKYFNIFNINSFSNIMTQFSNFLKSNNDLVIS